MKKILIVLLTIVLTLSSCNMSSKTYIKKTHFKTLVANESTRIVYIEEKELVYVGAWITVRMYTPYYSSNGYLCRYENKKLIEITENNKENDMNSKSASEFSAKISTTHFDNLVFSDRTGIVYISDKFRDKVPYYSSNGNLCRYENNELIEIADKEGSDSNGAKGKARISEIHIGNLVYNESTDIVYFSNRDGCAPYYSSNGNLCRYDNGKMVEITDDNNAKPVSDKKYKADIVVKHFDTLVANESTGIVYIVGDNGTHAPYFSSNGNLCRYENGKLVEIVKEDNYE